MWRLSRDGAVTVVMALLGAGSVSAFVARSIRTGVPVVDPDSRSVVWIATAVAVGVIGICMLAVYVCISGRGLWSKCVIHKEMTIDREGRYPIAEVNLGKRRAAVVKPYLEEACGAVITLHVGIMSGDQAVDVASREFEVANAGGDITYAVITPRYPMRNASLYLGVSSSISEAEKVMVDVYVAFSLFRNCARAHQRFGTAGGGGG